MRLKKSIGILIAALALGDTVGFAYQSSETPSQSIIPPAGPRSKKGTLGPVDFISAEELKTKIAKNENLSIIDLRAQASFEQSDQKIKGALHSRVRKVAYRLREIPRDREVITYCACPADEAAVLAARALLANGFKRVRVLKGGWNAWRAASGQTQPKPKGS
jgi:rhodanese-related sulfurtransferase